MTTNANVQSWRDLIGELTDEQITELQHFETLTYPHGVSAPEQLLAGAHARIRENQIQRECAGIPTPPDCIDTPSRWLEWDTNVHQRTYCSWRREQDGVTVEILANQYSDNRPIERTIWLTYQPADDPTAQGRLVGDDMDADQARLVGTLLLAAADELDRLNGDAPPF